MSHLRRGQVSEFFLHLFVSVPLGGVHLAQAYNSLICLFHLYFLPVVYAQVTAELRVDDKREVVGREQVYVKILLFAIQVHSCWGAAPVWPGI